MTPTRPCHRTDPHTWHMFRDYREGVEGGEVRMCPGKRAIPDRHAHCRAEVKGRDGWIRDLADALGEALEVIDALTVGRAEERAVHAERIAYFEHLWEGAPKPENRTDES